LPGNRSNIREVEAHFVDSELLVFAAVTRELLTVTAVVVDQRPVCAAIEDLSDVLHRMGEEPIAPMLDRLVE
jgi:hypothetical protein